MFGINHLGKLLLGVMIGGAIGAGVMLLSAPQSGESTRAEIKTRGLALKNKAEMTIQDTRDMAQDVVSKMGDKKDEFSRRLHLNAYEEQNTSPDM
jgi:gas vesicle protein